MESFASLDNEDDEVSLDSPSPTIEIVVDPSPSLIPCAKSLIETPFFPTFLELLHFTKIISLSNSALWDDYLIGISNLF